MYTAYIVKINELRKHNNADRLQVANIFDCNVIVDMNTKVGDIGIFFPVDGQLSKAYCEQNNLCRKKDENGKNIGGYLDEDKRCVRAMGLRGERSEGLFMPLTSLEKFCDISTLNVGDQITTINGNEICCKYIPKSVNRHTPNNSKCRRFKADKQKLEKRYPFFAEHIDTPQLKYNPDMFKPGELIIMTEKLHGSSERVANAFVYKDNLLSKIFKRPKYEYVGGTRRRIRSKGDSGYYGDEAFRDKWEDFFKGKLQKGETIYGEIVGFTEKNSPIMGRGDNTKLNDKDFVKRYGKTTTFSYGCDEDKGENDFYIYRITKTDEDGNVIEYPYDYIKIRAEQMGAKVVPEFERFIYTTHEDMMERVNKYLEGCSTIDSRHTREGIVLRADRADRYKVAKIKSYAFSVLEGLIKENADAPDMEEAQEI